MRTGKRVRRVGLGMVDQALYSLTNFALTILIARSVSVAEFGAYSVVFATYIICVGAGRGLTSETFLVRYSASDIGEWRVGARAASGLTCIVGFLFGAALASASLLLDGTLGRTMLILGALLPGLMLQDYLRFSALARGQPSLALWNDGTMAAAQFLSAGILIAYGWGSTWALVASWGGAAHIGAIVAAWRLGVLPQFSHSVRWFWGNKDLAIRYFLADLVEQGGKRGTFYVVAAVAGLAGAGALRGAYTLFGPFGVLNRGVRTAVIPELVRVLARSPRRMHRYVGLLAGGLAGLSLLWSVGVVAMPDGLGEALLGDTWRYAQPLLVFLAVGQVANGWMMAQMAGLRALGDGRRTLQTRSVLTAVSAVVTMIGAGLDGARGAAIAFAVFAPVQTLVWWRQFNQAFAEHVNRAEAHPSSTEKAPSTST